jgi:sugar transferase (PEP-CTERM/EpsH1 system associated)
MVTPTRIMHVVDNMGRGGMQNGLINLIEQLDPGRFEHVICTTRYLDHPQAHRGTLGSRVQIISLGKQAISSRVQLAGLARAIGEVKPDIVHSRNWAAIEAVIAARWAGSCAVVHSEHGLDAVTNTREPWRRSCFRRLAFELADRVLCVSRQLRSVHSKRTGFPLHKITVIHNGVDTRRYYPDIAARARIRNELKISENDFCIGCLGNLTPVKDYPTVLQAVGEFAKACTNWRLIIIGEGSELAELQGMVNAHPEMKHQVIFCGLSDRVPELLNAIDVYVLASLTEGISNSLLEAMATALPVAATNTGGTPEVVEHRKSGLLFAVGDCRTLAEHLVSLQSQPELRKQLARESLLRVRESFSLRTMVQKYEQLYESLSNRVQL